MVIASFAEYLYPDIKLPKPTFWSAPTDAEDSGADPKAFQYNDEARYQPGAQVFHARSVPSLDKASVLVTQDKGFEARYADVFEKYLMPPVKSESMITTWSSNPIPFWQNQLNFATWCATTGCGVSLKDHLTANDPPDQVFISLSRILPD